MSQYKEKGNEAIQQGNYKLAVEHFTKGIEAAPQDHFLYSNRSAAYLALDDYENALKDAEKAIELKPDWSKGYIRKGNVYVEVEKLEEATQTYKIASEKDPENEQTRKLVEAPNKMIQLKKEGNDKLMSGDIDGAIKTYTEAIKLKILPYVFYSNRSAAYQAQGKFQEALQDAEDAIKAKANFGKSYLRKGNALMGLKKNKEAEKAFQDGLKVDPKNSSLEKQLAAVKKLIAEDTKLVHIHSTEQWKDLLKSTKNLIVVDFYATWCGPCKQVAPYFEQFAKEITEVTFVKVDVDQCKEIAVSQKIRAMPTFQFIKNGKVLDTLEGADLQGMLNRIEKYSK